MLLNILQCTGRLPTAKNYQAQNASSDKINLVLSEASRQQTSCSLGLEDNRVCERGRFGWREEERRL